MAFSDLVKEKGSVAAALASQGYTKSDSGKWSKSGSSGTSSSGSSGSSDRSDSSSGSKKAAATSTAVKNTASSSGSASGYYDPNKDYSLAIKQAQDSGASAAYIAQLQTERQNKVNAQYGGKDPYKGTTAGIRADDVSKAVKNIWDTAYSGGTSQLTKGPGYVTGGYTPGGTYGTPVLEDNPYWSGGALTGGADMSRRPDLAGSYAVSNGYTVFYDEDGYATRARKGVVDYTPHKDLNVGTGGSYGSSGAWTDSEMLTAADQQRIQSIRAQLQAGQITGDQANQLANEIRSGYGYTIDKAGNVTDLGALSSVAARRQAWGLPTDGVSAAQRAYLLQMYPELQNGDPSNLLAAQYALNQRTQGTYAPTALQARSGGGLDTDIMSFDAFLAGTGYGAYSSAVQNAIRASVQSATQGYNQQIQDTNDETDELARQAYIAKMLGQKNLSQQLSANGYAGGMADSQMIATETDYQNQLTSIEKQRLQTITELQNAITQAQLAGDMQAAQELAGYLQTVQGQYVNYAQNQQQIANQNYWNQAELDNQNYWNQQNLAAQNLESAYTRALNLIQSGFMPDSTTLSAAGISELEASNMVKQVQTQLAQEAKKAAASSSKGSSVSKPVLTYTQVMDAIKKGNITPNVLSGYKYYMGTDYDTGVTGGDAVQADTSKLSAAGRGLWNIIQQLGDDPATATGRIDKYLASGQITQDEAATILQMMGVQ